MDAMGYIICIFLIPAISAFLLKPVATDPQLLRNVEVDRIPIRVVAMFFLDTKKGSFEGHLMI